MPRIKVTSQENIRIKFENSRKIFKEKGKVLLNGNETENNINIRGKANKNVITFEMLKAGFSNRVMGKTVANRNSRPAKINSS